MPDHSPDDAPPALRTAAELFEAALATVEGLPPSVAQRLAELAASPAELSAEEIREILEGAARA